MHWKWLWEIEATPEVLHFGSDGWSGSFCRNCVHLQMAFQYLLCASFKKATLEQSCNWLQNISNENENCRSTSAALALLLLRDVALVRERDAGRHNAFCTSLLFVVQNLCKAQCTTQKESCSAHLLFHAPYKPMKHGICIFSTVYWIITLHNLCIE